MNTVELIKKKRNGGALSREEMEQLLRGYLAGDVADYQMAAFLMAVYFTGMTDEETWNFTEAMLHSGTVIDLSSIPGTKVDKHSTGGVGDKVSLLLAPMVAACGVPVPMISGRGLGHTGGTLDKLEAIPGFRTRLSLEEYRRNIADIGLVLAGQTDEVAPADRKLYALRDVTATIESFPLIAGSIMSKKLAEGIDALVLDIKTGNGAFMRSHDEALALATALTRIGTLAGKRMLAFVTDMNAPLGRAIGNWLEVVEAVECLRGRNIPDLLEVSTVLGGAMVYLGGRATSIEEGMQRCRSAIWSGAAYEKFLEVVRRQGGDVSVLEQPRTYPPARFLIEVHSRSAGFVRAFDTRRLGQLAVELGAGRRRISDTVDPKAGIILCRVLGEEVHREDVLAVVRTDLAGIEDQAVREVLASLEIGPEPVAPASRVLTLVEPAGVRHWQPPVVS